ncbi:5-guanidino-2-oxopentanoate decarboxylase [Mesorhizobium xinjiangense]|uniref:5-guanidino-2-oxopentanoate decarboxylase n=1 Tax=Mesorhizobium xinjiangense TaxID=2678685 RepID=UPI0012ED3818|nr:5-guanidino-2-oxopentanoate decarboxylase [Mesorhizobium xinjiangense]
MTTVGEALVRFLQAYGVKAVFGIPGVHTIELYRGLATSEIRHVTPRHEQAAGFMADGYARATGKPGVAFVITGPGLTNAITAMAQARADSIPMLVVSGVNARDTLGKGLGFLHELPDQRAMMASFCRLSMRVEEPTELAQALERAFVLFASERPGPVHIEIPTDVMGLAFEGNFDVAAPPGGPLPDPADIESAAGLLAVAQRPAILVGGGARGAARAVQALAERLDAPVVATTNARGLMHGHRLLVPASPSLDAVRALVADSDVVLAIGTEFGPTDYDMNGDGGFPNLRKLVRIDIDPAQLARQPADVAIAAPSDLASEALLTALLKAPRRDERIGQERAGACRAAAWEEIGARYRAHVGAIEAVRDALPGAMIVGDSTQAVYAANLFYDHDRAGGWFNAATGYGALGYGPAAAIGAAIGRPEAPTVCLTGDGGLQFTLAELGSALDERAKVIFVVWNNRGYQEIEAAMRAVQIAPVGVTPSAPDFVAIARAYGLQAERIDRLGGLAAAVARAAAKDGPALIEIVDDPLL